MILLDALYFFPRLLFMRIPFFFSKIKKFGPAWTNGWAAPDVSQQLAWKMPHTSLRLVIGHRRIQLFFSWPQVPTKLFSITFFNRNVSFIRLRTSFVPIQTKRILAFQLALSPTPPHRTRLRRTHVWASLNILQPLWRFSGAGFYFLTWNSELTQLISICDRLDALKAALIELVISISWWDSCMICVE